MSNEVFLLLFTGVGGLAALFSWLLYRRVKKLRVTGDKGFIEVETPVGTKELRWPRETLPLFVSYDPTANKLTKHLAQAVDYINGELGLDVFLYAGQLTREETAGQLINVQVVSGVENGHTALAFDKDGNITAAPITIGSEMPREVWFRALIHELLHVLGLTHDEFEESVMYKKAVRGHFEITGPDKQRLREWYGPQQ